MDLQWWCSAQGVPWTWAWRAYPGVWLTVAALSFGYFQLLRRREQRTFPVRGAMGLLLIWVSLDWPIGVLGVGYLASVHVFKFLVLAFLAPPLLWSDVSGVVEDLSKRETLAGRSFHALTTPFFAALFFNVVLVVTHIPVVVDSLAVSQLGSFFNDALWLLAGTLFWWPVYSPSRIRHALLKVLYVFLGALSHNALGIGLLIDDYPTYEVYELAPRIADLSARMDQGLAGTAMLFGGTFIVFTVIAIIFVTHMREERHGAGRGGR